MSQGSSIEWTDATWNPVVGCTRVSAGCDHCYAVGMTRRLEGMAKGGPNPGRAGSQQYVGLTVKNPRGDVHFNGTVRCVEHALEIPLRWKRPARIFVNSMSDLFHREVPFEFIDRVFAVMALCPQHTFQVLTKRPERMAEYLNERYQVPATHAELGACDVWEHREERVKEAAFEILIGPLGDADERWRPDGSSVVTHAQWPLPNVWLGTSCEDQAAADERIPHLLRCPAAVRFLSCEPLLGPVEPFNLKPGVTYTFPAGERIDRSPIHWVIVGGESGPGARPCAREWIYGILDQCKAAGVPCFIKQLGSRSVVIARSMASMFNNSGEQVVQEDAYKLIPLRLTDTKGGDMSEWPDDLRAREFPRRSTWNIK